MFPTHRALPFFIAGVTKEGAQTNASLRDEEEGDPTRQLGFFFWILSASSFHSMRKLWLTVVSLIELVDSSRLNGFRIASYRC